MILEFSRKKKAAKNVANIFQSLKPSGPAPKVKAKAAPSEPPKPSGTMGETEEANPVKPVPNPKRHPEDKGDRGRSTSVDKRKISCKFYAKGNCTQGKGCPYSHKKSRTPSRSTSPKGEGKTACPIDQVRLFFV